MSQRRVRRGKVQPLDVFRIRQLTKRIITVCANTGAQELPSMRWTNERISSQFQEAILNMSEEEYRSCLRFVSSGPTLLVKRRIPMIGSFIRSIPLRRQELRFMSKVQSVLTEDLLKAQFHGHCYVAAEALFHLLGGKAAGYTPMNMKHEGISHWWLRTPRGDNLDPTASQFKTPVPYFKGRGRGFLTNHPSKRCRTVLKRMGAVLGVGHE